MKWGVLEVILAIGTLHLLWLLVQMISGLIKGLRKPFQPLAGANPTEEVLLLIPVCNEEAALLEQTLVACRELQRTRLVVIENSSDLTAKAALEACCKNLGVECYSIDNLGNKARALNHYLRNNKVTQAFISVLDVDQQPTPAYIDEILACFVGRDQLGLVQTPQFFRNANRSALTFLYAAMQDIFFRAVCVARGHIGFAPCLGTNFIVRRVALEAAGLFNEDSQTEDVATSLRIALVGYQTRYLDKVLVKGLVPNRFGDVLKQMKRYSIGSNQIMGSILGDLLWRPKNWSLSSLLVLAHYGHYASTLLVGSVVFYVSFFSTHLLVWINLICIAVFLLLALAYLPFYRFLAGLLFFSVMLPFMLIFNLDITAYNRKFAVTRKKVTDLEEEVTSAIPLSK